jgi:drug/metabolite transporter (DMT)-like permease
MSDNIRASLYMVLSMAGFAINDALIKTLDGALPTGQIMGIRGLFLSVLILLLIWQRGLFPRIREALTAIVFLRASMELLATLFFLSALMQLPFANISAILQSLPLAVTLGAALVFKEAVGWRRWLAIAVGFIGVLIIIRPGSTGFDPASILVAISVLFAAARDLSTRALPKALPSLLVTAATAVLVSLFGFCLVLVQGSWVPPETEQMKTLGFASAFLFVGYQFIILAMRTGEVAYVVPYRYTSLLFSIILGYIFFAEVPDKYTILGSAIVISMGLFTLYRELIRAKNRP